MDVRWASGRILRNAEPRLISAFEYFGYTYGIAFLVETVESGSRALVCDSKQFNLEDERCAAGNDRRASSLAVSNVGRTHELGFSSDFHSLNAFGPARNHLIQRKLSGLISFIRAVELGSISQGTAIIHGHNVAGSRRSTRTGPDFAIDQTARGLDCAGFCSGLFKKRGGFGFRRTGD